MAFDPAAATAAYMATIPAEVTAQSIAYTNGKNWLLLWGFIVSLVIAWALVRWGILEKIRDRISAGRTRPFRTALLVGMAYMLLSSLIELPWQVYSGWWRELHYGLTKQPFGDWLGQGLISLAISTVLFGLFFAGLYALIRRWPERWWLGGGLFAGAAVGLMIVLSPVFIEPLFNDYKPFPEGPVKEAIVALAKESHVPADRIFVYDGSRQRDVVTANVAGALGTARIAVSDIALERASLAEVRAVVGHEIGHYVLGHAPRTALFAAIMMLVAFYGVHRLFGLIARWMQPHGITGIADPAGLPVLGLVVALVFLLATPILNSYIRLGEREADQYSLDHARDPDGLATALIKTVEYRKASPGPVEEVIFHSHPGVESRVRHAMEWKAANLAATTAREGFSRPGA